MKLLVIAIVAILAYKLFTSNRGIEAAEPQEKIEDENYADYEEIE